MFLHVRDFDVGFSTVASCISGTGIHTCKSPQLVACISAQTLGCRSPENGHIQERLSSNNSFGLSDARETAQNRLVIAVGTIFAGLDSLGIRLGQGMAPESTMGQNPFVIMPPAASVRMPTLSTTRLSAVGIIVGLIVVGFGFVNNLFELWCACAPPNIGNYCTCTPFDWTVPAIGGIIIVVSLVVLAWSSRNKRLSENAAKNRAGTRQPTVSASSRRPSSSETFLDLLMRVLGCVHFVKRLPAVTLPIFG